MSFLKSTAAILAAVGEGRASGGGGFAASTRLRRDAKVEELAAPAAIHSAAMFP